MAKTKPTAKAKAAPVPDYATPEALRLYDFDTQKRATEFERQIATSKGQWDRAKALATEAKKTYEADVIELRTWIRERHEKRGKPPAAHLFKTAEDKEKAGELKATDAKAGAVAAATGWYPEDLWRAFPIKGLMKFGLTAADVEKIEAGEVKKGNGIGPIRTMGDLSKFTEPIGAYSRNYGDLKGIGNAGVERLHEAEAKFWTAWKNGLAETFAVEKGHKRPEPTDGNAGAAGDGDQDSGGGDPKPGKAAAGKAK